MAAQRLLGHSGFSSLSSSRDLALRASRFMSTTRSMSDHRLSIVDLLQKDLGLSYAEAQKSAPMIYLFQRHDFSLDNMKTIFTRRPNLLKASSSDIIGEKLKFLSNELLKGELLVKTITKDPFCLRPSLKKAIIPCVGIMRIYLTKEEIEKHAGRILRHASSKIEKNFEIFHSYGIPRDAITKLLLRRPRTFSIKPEVLSWSIERVKEKRFDMDDMNSTEAISVIATICKEKWQEKRQIFYEFGWTEQDHRLLFRSRPDVMYASVTRIRVGLAVLRDILDWGPAEVCKYACVMRYSLPTRVLPRAHVLKELVTRQYLKKEDVGQGFVVNEAVFVKRFVKPYSREIPELCEIYKKKFVI